MPRKVSGIERAVALATQSLVKGDSEVQNLSAPWCRVEQGKERILSLSEFPFVFLVAHEHGLGRCWQVRVTQGHREYLDRRNVIRMFGGFMLAQDPEQKVQPLQVECTAFIWSILSRRRAARLLEASPLTKIDPGVLMRSDPPG